MAPTVLQVNSDWADVVQASAAVASAFIAAAAVVFSSNEASARQARDEANERRREFDRYCTQDINRHIHTFRLRKDSHLGAATSAGAQIAIGITGPMVALSADLGSEVRRLKRGMLNSCSAVGCTELASRLSTRSEKLEDVIATTLETFANAPTLSTSQRDALDDAIEASLAGMISESLQFANGAFVPNQRRGLAYAIGGLI